MVYRWTAGYDSDCRNLSDDAKAARRSVLESPWRDRRALGGSASDQLVLVAEVSAAQP
jgi:hypothetical protein